VEVIKSENKAYYDAKLITAEKRFMVQDPVVFFLFSHQKSFFALNFKVYTEGLCVVPQHSA
jgi:hypothetical protein